MATEVICIVDTDGTQSPDYTSLSAAIAGETGGSPACVTSAALTTNDEQLTIKCRATAGGADSTAVTISGFTTDSTRYVKVIADTGHRHSGKWDTSKYRLDCSSVDGVLTLNANYTVIIGLQVKLTTSDHFQFVVRAANYKVTLIGNYIELSATAKASGCITGGGGSADSNFYNNVVVSSSIYNHINSSCLMLVAHPAGSTQNVYNNTFKGAYYGISNRHDSEGVGYVLNIKNNVLVGSTDNFYDVGADTLNMSYNASDDADGTSAQTLDDTNSYENDFTDYSNNDMSLVSGSCCVGNGTDDPSSGDYSDDIAGTERSSTWDIGAFEYVSGGVEVSADTESLILTEQDATVKLNVSVAATCASLTLTEYSADVNLDVSVNASCEALTLTEYSAGINAEINVQAEADALTLTEYAANVNAEISVDAATDALVLTEHAATVNAGVNVTAGIDALTLTEYPAGIKADTNISAGTDALVLTEHNAVVSGDLNVEAETASLTLTEYAANINAAVTVDCETATWTLAEYAATIKIDTTVQTEAESLILTEYGANINAEISVQAAMEALTLTEYAATVATSIYIPELNVEVPRRMLLVSAPRRLFEIIASKRP